MHFTVHHFLANPLCFLPLPGLETVSSLTSSLLASRLASLPPAVSNQLASIKSLGQERLPEVVFTGLSSARDQVIHLFSIIVKISFQAAAYVSSLDTTLCTGLDQLVDQVLYSSTPS